MTEVDPLSQTRNVDQEEEDQVSRLQVPDEVEMMSQPVTSTLDDFIHTPDGNNDQVLNDIPPHVNDVPVANGTKEKNTDFVTLVRNGNFMAEFFKSRRTWHGYVPPTPKSVHTQTDREPFGLTCNGSRREYTERYIMSLKFIC